MKTLVPADIEAYAQAHSMGAGGQEEDVMSDG